MKLVLFSGAHCHLCDIAMALLEQSIELDSVDFSKVDIASSHELYHLYGARIPVLKRCDNEQELGWPFNQEQLLEFLR